MADKITYSSDGHLQVPDEVVIPFIEGDGTGPDIWRAAVRVFDAAISRAYSGKRKVKWHEVLAGEKAFNKTGDWLPQETLDIFRDCKVGIKGPLTTPIGGGFRSLNVTIRQELDLYACIRPVTYIPGVPSPMKQPEKVNIIVFRENTEDVYAGIEWKAGTKDAEKVIDFFNSQMGQNIRPDTGIGIKPISAFGSKRLVRRAIRWAVANRRKSVTLVHKGNIMKFTEGAFKEWGYEVAKEEFGDEIVLEAELMAETKDLQDRIVFKDRIADAMFQQIILRPEEYDVLAMPNLNGDYMSDALAAQVGGLGMAPGGNIGDQTAVFEATHGAAPKYAGKDMVNPGSIILSGALMFEYIGWSEVAKMIKASLEKTVRDKIVTYDLARQMRGAKKVKCSGFGETIIDHM